MKEYQLSHREVEKEYFKTHYSENETVILCDGINDVGNIGMIFRIADALRINKIFLYNLKPDFNFKLLKKKSRSTSEFIPFEIISFIKNVEELHKNYYFIIADKTNKSIHYSDYLYQNKNICFVFGSEKYGVSQEIIDLADASVHLPMYGKNTSINVATAAAVILYDFVRKKEI